MADDLDDLDDLDDIDDAPAITVAQVRADLEARRQAQPPPLVDPGISADDWLDGSLSLHDQLEQDLGSPDIETVKRAAALMQKFDRIKHRLGGKDREGRIA